MLHWPYMLIKKIGLLYHPMVPATLVKAQELRGFLISMGVGVWVCSSWDTEKAMALLDGTDLILTAGGDGTILRAAQVALQSGTPIIGVNMGKLGFLTELKADEAVHQLPTLLAGKGWIDERAMLEAELQTGGPGSPVSGTFYALNDVVLARGETARLIQVNTSINDKPLTNYRADGVVVASATGSTAYSLAAAGPILFPQLTDLLLVPIVPHLGLGYSLVLPSDSVIKLQLVSFNQATLSIDGHINIPVINEAVVTLKLSSRKTRFLRLNPQDYFFNVLEEKLRGIK
jgi:NAD+ kinase